MFRKFEIKLADRENTESAARWLSGTLSTITSNVFTEFTICIPSFYTPSEDRVRAWNLVDNVLGRLNLRKGVTLVVTRRLTREDEHSIEKCFPLMWKNRRVVLKVPPPDTLDELLRALQRSFG